MDRMKPTRLSTALAILFSVPFALAVGILALVLRFSIETSFQSYLDNTQAATHGRIMGILNSLHSPDGLWNTQEVAALGREALLEGLVLALKDGEGKPVWDARTDDPETVAQVFATLERNLKSRIPWETGRWETWEHPVEDRHGAEATMVLEIFQPRRLGPSDLAFLEGMDFLLAAAALAGLVLSSVLGYWTARWLVQPLKQLQNVSYRLAAGDYSPPDLTSTAFTEIEELETTFRQLAERLAHLQALRDTAGADTAHELRTPLANLEAQLEALEDGVLEPSTQRFATLGKEIRRLKDLVQAWEDLERARFQPSPSRLTRDPGLVIARVVDTFRTRTQTLGQILTFQADSEVLTLPLAEADLVRVLVNLVENAHRHTPKNGSIEILLTKNSKGTELTVDDSGQGIPAGHRDAVFDRFYRVEASRSRNSGGLGLGLNLVKILVESSGGTIEALESPKQGCRIRMHFLYKEES